MYILPEIKLLFLLVALQRMAIDNCVLRPAPALKRDFTDT